MAPITHSCPTYSRRDILKATSGLVVIPLAGPSAVHALHVQQPITPNGSTDRQKAFIATRFVLHVIGFKPRSRMATTKRCSEPFVGSGRASPVSVAR